MRRDELAKNKIHLSETNLDTSALRIFVWAVWFFACVFIIAMGTMEGSQSTYISDRLWFAHNFPGRTLWWINLVT